MSLPTEPIGSIPRTPALIHAMQQQAAEAIDKAAFDRAADEAIRETIAAMEATGSPVISDGEQTKPSFATYPIHGLSNLAPDGVTIPFADGHTRQLPRLSAGPFRYNTYADTYTIAAKRYATRPVKQAVISPSALSLLYPRHGLDGYSQDAFLADLTREAETDIRRALVAGAHAVQLDFTEGRLAVKLDPTLGLLRTSSRSTTTCSTGSASRNAPGSACTRALAAIAIRRTAPTWITHDCYPTCSRCRLGISTSSSRVNATVPVCWISSRR